jgi:hypothetical protein
MRAAAFWTLLPSTGIASRVAVIMAIWGKWKRGVG